MGAQGGRPNKIRSSGLEGAVRKLASDGLAYREISAELKRRGQDVSAAAIGRFLTEEAGERREVARNVVAEQAHADVPLVTSSLRKWVGDIGDLVSTTMEGLARELDPDEKDKKLNRAAQNVSTLVNAGAKAAKLLHDITMGEEPASKADDFLRDAQAILEAKRLRDAEQTEDDGEPLH